MFTPLTLQQKQNLTCSNFSVLTPPLMVFKLISVVDTDGAPLVSVVSSPLPLLQKKIKQTTSLLWPRKSRINYTTNYAHKNAELTSKGKVKKKEVIFEFISQRTSVL